jgi:hypothetical protein
VGDTSHGETRSQSGISKEVFTDVWASLVNHILKTFSNISSFVFVDGLLLMSHKSLLFIIIFPLLQFLEK